MHLDIVPNKTARAREVLLRRDALPHNQRLFLIMIDGQKSLRDLSQAASQLGIDSVALAALVNAGLVAWHGGEGGAASGAGRAPAATPEGHAPRSLPSLAAAKLYAIDLAALMLPAQDRELRESARQVTDADELRAWIHEVAARIAARASDDRAALFLDKVGALLPADFLAAQAPLQTQ